MNDGQPQTDEERGVYNILEHLQIPECCKEGWESCPHVVPKARKEKRNIAL